ncbi:MAG: Thioredoxin [Candidatus Diapherotrites archaeon]|nr:Thioredoxin [Candidatus Diapherotrites archaeon]MDN5367235.1 Thioredoxin [Candidatus Diapherotrites archaeon]
MDFSLSTEMGPRWIMLLAGVGLILSFAAGLANSTMFYALLPKDENADILVFYQPTCPHCIAEIPTIQKLVSEGISVSAFNVFKYPELTKKYNVTETPTLVITKTGKVLRGEQDYETIKQALAGEKTELWGISGSGCAVNKDNTVGTCSPT